MPQWLMLLPMAMSLMSSVFGKKGGAPGQMGMPGGDTGGNLAKIQQQVAPANPTANLLPSGPVTAASPQPSISDALMSRQSQGSQLPPSQQSSPFASLFGLFQ